MVTYPRFSMAGVYGFIWRSYCRIVGNTNYCIVLKQQLRGHIINGETALLLLLLLNFLLLTRAAASDR